MSLRGFAASPERHDLLGKLRHCGLGRGVRVVGVVHLRQVMLEPGVGALDVVLELDFDVVAGWSDPRTVDRDQLSPYRSSLRHGCTKSRNTCRKAPQFLATLRPSRTPPHASRAGTRNRSEMPRTTPTYSYWVTSSTRLTM